MVVQTAELFFNDTPSRYNKDLTDFLERNIRTIITKGQIQFRFKIMKSKDINSLRAKGIRRLPAMILRSKPFIGVPIIVEELRKSVKRSKTVAAPRSDEEMVRDYMYETLGNIQHDADGKHIIPKEEMDDEADLGGLYQAEMQRRNGGNDSRDTRRAPPKPDRQAIQDNDYDEQPRQQHQPPPRMNNVDQNEPGSATAALNNLTRSNGKHNQDDEMLRTLMDRIGGDDGFNV